MVKSQIEVWFSGKKMYDFDYLENENTPIILLALNYLNSSINGPQVFTIEEILLDFDFDKQELICIICYLKVPKSEVRIFNCCSSIGHKDHLDTWFSDHNNCPFCKNENFVILNPMENSI